MMNEKTINVINVSEIKEVMVEKMLTCCLGKKIDKKELTKFFQYLDVLSQNNNSKSNLDNRVESIYKLIQKIHKDYTKLYSFMAK